MTLICPHCHRGNFLLKVSSKNSAIGKLFNLLMKMAEENKGFPIDRQEYLKRAETIASSPFLEETIDNWINDGVITKPNDWFVNPAEVKE
jgi:hypothetical protein